MKVGTDAILIGAWAGKEMHSVNSILDVGTGTGIIAIMLAQRFASADVTAIDVDSNSAHEANENFRSSPWNNRCRAINAAAQNINPPPKYSLIVSNPPWFHDSLKPPDSHRRIARHTDELSFIDLTNAAARLLHPDGRFCVIIPFEAEGEFLNAAATAQMYCHRRCRVRPTPESKPKRLLLEFGLEVGDCVEESLAVEESRHQFTPEYATLTAEFLPRAARQRQS